MPQFANLNTGQQQSSIRIELSSDQIVKQKKMQTTRRMLS